MQKWEYLELTTHMGSTAVTIGKPIKKEAMWVNGEVQGKSNGEWLSKTIYPDFYGVLKQLGENGWELINVTTTNQGFISHYMFKRPID